MKKALLFASVFAITVLTAVLLFVLPASADTVHSGKWGNLDWTLNETTGELVISGEGEMDDLSGPPTDAWRTYETSIKSVVIENGITSIGNSAFFGCSSLSHITIPDSVTSIGQNAFLGCGSLTYNNYDNAYYFGNDSNPFLFLAEAKSRDITSCQIHTDTRFIGSSAFYGCESLSSITIPDSVTSIGASAFNCCGSLTSITIPDSVTSIDSYAFEGCTRLKNLTIGNGVTSIGSSFLYCTSLESVTIPNSVTSIGNSAFYYCTSLSSITIPNSVTSIGDYAFYYCTSLKNVKYDGTQEQWDLIEIGIYNEDLINALKGDDKESGDKNTDGGCGSVVSGGFSMMALITLAGGMIAVKKKK